MIRFHTGSEAVSFYHGTLRRWVPRPRRPVTRAGEQWQGGGNVLLWVVLSP